MAPMARTPEPSPALLSGRTAARTTLQVPGSLLNFKEEEHEQQWQSYFHRSHLSADRLCSVVLILWAATLARRWHHTWRTYGGPALGTGWYLAQLSCGTTLLALQCRRERWYLRHRAAVVAAARLLHLAALFAVIYSNEYSMWPLRPEIADASTLRTMLTTQAHRVLHLLAASVAYTLPLRWNLPLLLLGAAGAMAMLPGRCQAECYVVAGHAEHMVAAARALAHVGRGWVFSAAQPAATAMQPWQDCCVVNAFLQLLLGVALPALLLANVEENSRQRFLRLRDGQPFFYSAAAQMWFSLGALPLLAAVVYQAVSLVVRALL